MNARPIEHLKETALGGGPEASAAMKELGSRYWSGTNGAMKDEAEAHKWWLKASEAGNAAAMVAHFHDIVCVNEISGRSCVSVPIWQGNST